MLAHDVRGGRWIPLGRLPSMEFDGAEAVR
jgi:hypothetical protein